MAFKKRDAVCVNCQQLRENQIRREERIAGNDPLVIRPQIRTWPMYKGQPSPFEELMSALGVPKENY